jgi:hypothetical protein
MGGQHGDGQGEGDAKEVRGGGERNCTGTRC